MFRFVWRWSKDVATCITAHTSQYRVAQVKTLHKKGSILLLLCQGMESLRPQMTLPAYGQGFEILWLQPQLALEEYEALLRNGRIALLAPIAKGLNCAVLLLCVQPQMTLEEYEAVLAEKRAGLNKTRDPAFKADKTQFKGMKSFEKVRGAVVEEASLGLQRCTA